jgi:HD-GYP domain-containing protein (c-di-GMP phosphodiesterase class II)
VVDEAVIPFTSVDKELVSSLTSQAAVAFENTRLIQDIKDLFDSFVRASVTAIEQRDPTTSGHSGRVATLTVGLAEHADAATSGSLREVRFTRDQIQEIRYASLLHDFGKVGVREKVLIKEKKLYTGEMLVIRQRFAYIKRTLEVEHLRAKMEQIQSGQASPELLLEMDLAHRERQHEIDQILRMIEEANRPSILEEESLRHLMDLPRRTFPDLEGNPQPYLTPDEKDALSIRRGSLSQKEFREIQNHVTHTFHFLSQIPWTGEFSRIPEIAYAHHEKLDGSGYPRGLSGEAIPLAARIFAVVDVWDALNSDRPYRRALPREEALQYIEEQRGKHFDPKVVDIFLRFIEK